MLIKAVIFDLDGTLLDTLNDIANAVEGCLAARNLKGHPIEDYRFFIGKGMHELVKRAAPKGFNPSLLADLHQEVQNHYARSWMIQTAPYPGVSAMLKELEKSSITLMVLSNKPHVFAVQMVNYFFMENHFSDVRGQQEGVTIKPAPDAVLEMTQQAGLTPEECLFVGDLDVDILTGKNANMRTAGVLWGFSPEKMKKAEPDYLLQAPDDLIALLDNLNRKS